MIAEFQTLKILNLFYTVLPLRENYILHIRLRVCFILKRFYRRHAFGAKEASFSIFLLPTTQNRPGSVVGIATGYGLHGPGIEII